MAKIRQIGAGCKTSGTLDGITYVTRGEKTYVRVSNPPSSKSYNTPEARKRQFIFKMIHMHLKYHYGTIKQTFKSDSGAAPRDRYLHRNYKPLAEALDNLGDYMVAGEHVTISEVEEAISAYAQENPEAICIACRDGYQELYLTGTWPSTITLNPTASDGTVIVIMAKINATTTVVNPDGSTVITPNPTPAPAPSGE